MEFKTIKFRLNLLYSIVFFSVFAVSGIGIYIFLDSSLHRSLDKFLEKEAEELENTLGVDETGKIFIADSIEFREPEHIYLNESAVFFRIFDRKGDLVSHSENYLQFGKKIPYLATSGKTITEAEIEGKRLRMFYLPIERGGKFYGWVETSKFEGTIQMVMRLLKLAIIISIAISVLIASYGGK